MADPVTPSSPPPDYDVVMSGKEKPPSYESQTARPPENESNSLLNLEPISTQPTRRMSVSEFENGLGCEQYYDSEKNNPFVCLICCLFCWPITTCIHLCEKQCCQSNSGTEERRNYDGTFDNNYVYASNNTAPSTGGCCYGGDCGGGDDAGGGDWGGGNDDGGGDWGSGGDPSGGGDWGGGDTGGGGDCGDGGDTGGGGDCGDGGDTGGGGDCSGGGDTGGSADCGGGDSGGGDCGGSSFD